MARYGKARTLQSVFPYHANSSGLRMYLLFHSTTTLGPQLTTGKFITARRVVSIEDAFFFARVFLGRLNSKPLGSRAERATNSKSFRPL